MTIQKPTPNKSKHIQLLRRASDKIDYNRVKPTFCLWYIDRLYCISCCDHEEKAGFADTLLQLSQMTWNEIRSAHRHGLGGEKISRDAIKRPIPEHVTDDVTFIAFRFSGKKPMVGYRMKEMFHIVWLDRDFTLYDHG
jgi:hypothetical protein